MERQILSIAQDIVYVGSNEKKFTPKHVGLALTIHQKTKKRKLVTLLNKAGHCLKYKDVLKIDRNLAKLTLDSLDPVTGAVIPPNTLASDKIVDTVPSKTQSFIPVLHVTADNIDLLTDTLDGKNTFHATQMVVFQRGGKSSDEVLDSIQVKNVPTSLSIPEILNFLPENQIIESDPKFDEPVKIEWYNNSDSDEIKKARAKDLTFFFSRQNKPDDKKFGWTRFNKDASTEDSIVTASGFMPLILNPAHECNTLITVLNRCIALGDKLNYKYIVLTVDQALHCKLLDIKWSSPIFQERIILKMGGLHIALNYMKAIGQHMRNTGLAEIWIESGVLSEGSVTKVLNGKSYSKGIRIHKLTCQALWRILIPRFMEFLKTENETIYERISNLSQDAEFSLLFLDTTEVQECLQTFLRIESEKNVNFAFWVTYIESVAILLMFTRGLRDANWKLYLHSLNKMLPLVVRYDHYNYLKSMTVYIADMNQLPTIVKNAFEAGDFVVKKVDSKFNQVDADHAQEWLVGTCKASGGIKGITNKPATLHKWALSFHWRSEISQKTFSMYGLTPVNLKHNEENPGRQKRDVRDENKILEFLNYLNILSNDSCPDKLQNAATKDVATKEIQEGLLDATKKGYEQVIDFVEKRLILQENGTTLIGYGEKCTKNNAPTMSDIFTTLPPVVSQKKLINVDRNYLQRLVMALEAGRKIDLQSILKHELHNFPLALVEPNGSMRSGDSTPFFNLLVKEVECPTTLPLDDSTSHFIINGTEMIMNFSKPPFAKTFGDLANYFVSELKKLTWNNERVDILFDHRNETFNEKETTKTRLKSFAPVRKLIENENVPLPQSMPNFLSLDANKEDLTNFLSEKLSICDFSNRNLIVSGGFKDKTKVTSSDPSFNIFPLQTNHNEAKTRIIIHAINSNAKKVVVSTNDTEVLPLLIYHFRKMKCKQLWVKNFTSKKRLYVPVHTLVENLSVEVRENILAFNALTGSHRTSYLSGITKTGSWTVYKRHAKLLSTLGDASFDSKDKELVEQFFVKLYKVDENVKTADEARLIMFGQLKSFSSLPPTTDALSYHILRSHLQTIIWKNCDSPFLPIKDPEKYGWRLNEEHVYVPTLMGLEAIPSSCEKMKSCGCLQGCATKKCGCNKEDLPCMAICKCSRLCSNSKKS